MLLCYLIAAFAWGQDTPLNTKDAAFVLSNKKIKLSLHSVDTTSTGAVYGYCELSNQTSATSITETYVYVACEKQASGYDVYILSPFNGVLDTMINVRVDGSSASLMIDGSRDKKDVFKCDVDPAPKETKKKEKIDTEIIDKIGKIAESYKHDGRGEVRRTFGSTRTEKEREAHKAKAAEQARIQAQKKKHEERENNIPVLDKDGCIAFINNSGIAKVVSKKMKYDKAQQVWRWTCTVKNTSHTTIDSCFVHIKFVDKNGYELEKDIESVSNIVPGEKRTISGITHMYMRMAKSVKRKEFEVNVYH